MLILKENFLIYPKDVGVGFSSLKLSSNHLNFYLNLPNTSNDNKFFRQISHKYKSLRLFMLYFFSNYFLSAKF